MPLLEIDDAGLDATDRASSKRSSTSSTTARSAQTLAATMREECDTIMDVYEPFLIQQGHLQRTARGRVATPNAYLPANQQRSLDRPRC